MIERNHLHMFYHPIVDVHTGMWVGAEAEWCSHDLGKSCQTEEVAGGQHTRHSTRWICREVVKDYAQTFWACEDFYITIPVCAEDVLHPSFADFIHKLIIKYNISASCVAFAISEKLVAGCGHLTVGLERLRSQGHQIVLHDLALSDCSISFLDSLPADILKFDKTLLEEVNCYRIISALPLLLERAKMLDIEVVIADVKTDMQAKWIRAIGGTKAQGQLYSKALRAHEFTRTYFTRPNPCRLNVI